MEAAKVDTGPVGVGNDRADGPRHGILSAYRQLNGLGVATYPSGCLPAQSLGNRMGRDGRPRGTEGQSSSQQVNVACNHPRHPIAFINGKGETPFRDGSFAGLRAPADY